MGRSRYRLGKHERLFGLSKRIGERLGPTQSARHALYKLNRLGEAHEAYEVALKQTLLGSDKKTANDRVTEIAGKTGTITLKVNEAGASVSLDGKPAGTSPLAKPLRVLAGPHKVAVTKDGFTPFDSSVDVAAKGDATVDVQLKEPQKGAKVSVTIKGGEALKVSVDGAEVGAAPWEGTLAAGPHKISARSDKAVAAEVTIEVQAGTPQAVELVASEGRGTLEVRTEMPKSKISVDGKEVGSGSFTGELPAGEHELSVALDGYATATKSWGVAARWVRSIRCSKPPLCRSRDTDAPWSSMASIVVSWWQVRARWLGTRWTPPVTGATICDSANPWAAHRRYIGYAFAPIRSRLFLLVGLHSPEPTSCSPASRSPTGGCAARDESFTIGLFGGGGALASRAVRSIAFRITGAVGAGLAYRHMLLGRETVAATGATSSTGNDDGEGYLTGVLSVELAAQVLMAGTTSFVVGAAIWLEHAGDGVPTPAEGDVYLTRRRIPAPQATPSYERDRTQFFSALPAFTSARSSSGASRRPPVHCCFTFSPPPPSRMGGSEGRSGRRGFERFESSQASVTIGMRGAG